MTVVETIKYLEQFPHDAQLVLVVSELQDRTLLMAFKDFRPIGDKCLYQTTYTKEMREKALYS